MSTLVIGQTSTAVKVCKRRGCTAAAMSGSAYCTEVHERWDNPRVASHEVTR
jgi:hypothetical protein